MPPTGPIENAQAHVTIKQAYDELSQEALAVWIRLMISTDEELAGGRHKVCGILNLSEGRSNAILRQLKHKGYIALIKGDRPYTPTKIVILKRALLAGRHRFILLSNLLFDPQSGNTQAVLEDRQDLSQSLMSSTISGALGIDIGGCLAAVTAMPSDYGHKVDTNCFRHLPTKPGMVPSKKVTKEICSTSSTKLENVHAKPGSVANSDVVKVGVIKRMKCLVIGKIPGLGPKTDGGSKKGSIYIESKHKPSLIEKMKNKREEQRAKAKEQRAKSKGKGNYIDWRLLDSKGTPDVSFTPARKERERVSAMITDPDAKNNPEAKRIRNKLGTKFAIQYERYRKQKTGGYAMTNGEFEHAIEAAVLCYSRGITPVALIRYWDANIDNFHNGVMKIPLLPFLKSSYAIDGAVSGRIDDKGRPTRSPSEPIETHGFSDLSKLHKEIRPTLKQAGFKVEQYKDDVMLMIQKVAIPLKRGFKPGAPAEIEKMAAYIAEHHMEIDEDDNAKFVFDDGIDDED